MKWFVCMLSFYVLLLSGIPCNASDDCCGDETTQATPGKQAKDHDHQPYCPCSPFFACGACHGVVIPNSYTGFTKVVLPVVKLQYFYVVQPLPDFSPVIWQPPQLA
jgi:hypothetical protein